MSLVRDACSALTNGFFGCEKREIEKENQRKISKREKVNAYGSVRKAAISTIRDCISRQTPRMGRIPRKAETATPLSF